MANENRLSAESAMIVAGLISGVTVAGIFNPWDRALYLSVLHSRPFLDRANFVAPYTGFYQALFHRTLSGGLYFPLYDYFIPAYAAAFTAYARRHPESNAHPRNHPILLHFLAGNTAGAVSGVVLNQLTAIKYASWDGNRGFLRTAAGMWAAGGLAPFFKGIAPTVLRDTIFGGVFAVTKEMIQRPAEKSLRRRLSLPTASPTALPPAYRRALDFVSSLVAGAVGTVASSPLNYVRNIKYGHPPDSQPPSSYQILKQLWTETKSKARPLSFVQERLRIGWGTARVAVGMAVGYEIYEIVKAQLTAPHSPSRSQPQPHPPTASTTALT